MQFNTFKKGKYNYKKEKNLGNFAEAGIFSFFARRRIIKNGSWITAFLCLG
jgi:hypothetical protein